MHTEIHACVSTSGKVRPFESADDARRFVRREGNQSRLWSIEPVSAFKTAAIEAALAAEQTYEAALKAGNRTRWDAPRYDQWDDDIEGALAAKRRADKVMQLAFAIDRRQRAPFDVAELLRLDDDFIVQCLIMAQAFLTNVEILNALAGFNLTCAEWSLAFGGDVACGQGAIPPAIWERVKTVRHLAEAMRACLA